MSINVTKRAARRRPEQTLQQQLVAFLDKALPANALYFHVPNESHRTYAANNALKRMGMKSGAPDLIIFWNRRAYCLELKAGAGTLTDNQRAFHSQLHDAGIPVETVRSLKEAQVRLLEFGIPLRAEIGA